MRFKSSGKPRPFGAEQIRGGLGATCSRGQAPLTDLAGDGQGRKHRPALNMVAWAEGDLKDPGCPKPRPLRPAVKTPVLTAALQAELQAVCHGRSSAPIIKTVGESGKKPRPQQAPGWLKVGAAAIRAERRAFIRLCQMINGARGSGECAAFVGVVCHCHAHGIHQASCRPDLQIRQIR